MVFNGTIIIISILITLGIVIWQNYYVICNYVKLLCHMQINYYVIWLFSGWTYKEAIPNLIEPEPIPDKIIYTCIHCKYQMQPSVVGSILCLETHRDHSRCTLIRRTPKFELLQQFTKKVNGVEEIYTKGVETTCDIIGIAVNLLALLLQETPPK